MGFNNTGNVCLWPSEEVLAHLVEGGGVVAAGQRVLEIGAGMTALAGVVAGVVVGDGGVVVATDGNARSVELLRENLAANAARVRAEMVADMLVWDADATLEAEVAAWGGPFDVVLAADCLFFEDAHAALLNTLDRVVARTADARVVLVQPSRSGSAERFLALVAASGLFAVDVAPSDASYDARVSELDAEYAASDELYDRNLHLPLLAVLARP